MGLRGNMREIIINEIRVSGTLQGMPELRTRVLEDKTKEYSVRGFLRQRRNSWTDENGRTNYSYNMFQFRAKGDAAEQLAKRISPGMGVILTGSLQVAYSRGEYVTYIQVESVKTTGD